MVWQLYSFLVPDRSDVYIVPCRYGWKLSADYLVQEEQRTSEDSIDSFFHGQERTEDRRNDRRASTTDVREGTVSPKVENGIFSADVDCRQELQLSLIHI